MRTTKIYPAAALLALSLAACNNEEITPNPDTRVALQVTSGIQTRAYDDQWEKGDEIGILAYYPHTTDLENGIYTVDVEDQSDLSTIDLMAAGMQTANRINNTVTFNFEHKLSKIVLTFKPGDGMALSELTGMKVQLTNQQTLATFDVTDVTQPDGEVVVGTNTPATLTLNTDADGTSSEGIVLPSANFDGMTLHLELADGSSFFNWDLNKSQNADKFEAGKKYVYDITVNRSRLDVTATIEDWAPGNGENGEQGEAF